MAQLITVRLSREGGCPWGFRLQGGKDFGTPLVIQKVNGGSPAERAGLIAGDSVIRVNTTDVYSLRHKDAQDVIVRAGQSFEMTVQRGGSTWKPSVTPVGNVPRAQPVANNIAPVTRTSLAAQKQDYTPIGTSHNVAAKGFNAAATPHMNGDGPKLVNKQYNTPIGLYSEQSIAETLSAQAEVLSTGAMGVNFKKNEKNYDAEKSEVFKMLQEAEREPRTPEPARHDIYSTMSHAIGGRATSPRPMTPVPQKYQVRAAPDSGVRPTNVTEGNPTCSECERLIVGVFVRIKDKNLHVECFKCATCGSSLKNAGYYNINNKLYCDIHAKLAARNNPPAPNLVPITIPPGSKVPASAISSALASHSMPSPSPLSPSGNQVAAPFSPPLKYDNTDRYSPNNNYNSQKMDAVANLMSTLNMATQKDYKENGTNTEHLYFTEKTFPVNNNISNVNVYNNEIKDDQFSSPAPTVKYMPYRPKSASSFSGPRPFSSVTPSTPSAPAPFSVPSIPSTPIAAPISAPLSNTLPRSGSSATIPERKEWPPSKPEELPTACPLYINPASRNSTPQPKISNPGQNPEPNMPYIPVAHNPAPVSQPQMHISQNPLPQITISQNSNFPSLHKSETKHSKSHVKEHNSNYRSNQEINNISQTYDRNMSICSAEVTNITGRRSVVECVETVSGAIDTQMLVNQVTKVKERPKSPPPIQRKDSVYDTQDISIVVSTKTPSGKNPTENPIITVDDKSPENIKGNPQNTSNTGNPKGCPNICTSNPMSDPDCTIKITCPKNNPTCPMNQQYNVQNTANIQSSSNIQSTSSTSKQEASNISQTTSSTVIKNPVPQGYITPMVKALTIASDRPFNTVSVEIKSKEYGTGKTTQNTVETEVMTSKSTSSVQASQQMKSVQETMAEQQTQLQQKTMASQQTIAMQQSKTQQQSTAIQDVKSSQNVRSVQEVKENKFPHVRAPVRSSPLASALTIAPSVPFTPSPRTNQNPVSLPPETKPYFLPEIPITIEPKVQKQVTTCKSPFVNALTTAPDRPYTPLMGKGDEQSNVPDFMKDVPAPPKHKMSMLSALTTASDRTFTPALSPGNIEDILKPGPETPTHKVVPTPPPMPATIKPASHTSPSAFRPIGNSSFKPVVTQPEIPKIQTTSYYGQSVEQSYSVPTKFAPQQSCRSQFGAQSQQVTSQQQIVKEEQRVQNMKSVSYGLHSASSIPGYQINLSRKNSYPEQVFVPEIQAPIQPKQKPVTTLQPGQYQPNNHLQTFQPVDDESHSHYLRISSPIPRSISPSMINHPAPTIPYYQSDLVAHECPAVETNLFDPRSPAISRSPSPCPGTRSTSPFPRTMSKSPAQGPPPNPLQDRLDAKKLPMRDERYLAAKENLTSYIPKYQGRVQETQINQHSCQSQLSTGQAQRYQSGQSRMSSGQEQTVGQAQSYQSGQSQMNSGQRQTLEQAQSYQSGPSQVSSGQSQGYQSGQSQMSSGQKQTFGQFHQGGQSELSYGQSQVIGQTQNYQSDQSQQNQISAQSQSYQSVQMAHSERQQQSETCKISQVDDVRHMEQLNKSQMRTVETSADNRVQIQRTKRCTEEYERTQKEKTIEIQRTGGQIKSGSGGVSSVGFQRQISLEKAQKPFASVPNSRSYSLPGSSAGAPKPFKPSPLAATVPKPPGGSQSASRPNVSQPYAGGAATGRQAGAVGVVPRRGRGILNLASAPGCRVPMCGHCNMHIRGPFITALGKIWCPDHFICTTPSCRRPLQDMGFVEERGQLYCEYCFEQYLAPLCGKCNSKIKGDCLNAIGKHFHPECFACAYCSKLFGNSPFFLEEGLPYCEADWNELFTTKCFACGFPVEAGDRWVEALNNNYHSQCFNCTMCKKNLEGQSFYAKGGRPFCKNHAR